MDPVVNFDDPVPDFTLSDLDGLEHKLGDVRGKTVAIVFWSAECPWSKRADDLIRAWRIEWSEDTLLWTIASNVNEPLEMIREVSGQRGLETVLIDTDHQIADQFGAVTTPHCFVIDDAGRLRYRGAIDDTTFSQRQATRYYLKDAIASVRTGVQPDPAETPGYGCTIIRSNMN